uniref:D27 isomerase n=1 Tax=Crocus sativus TaxID=82528 RepID=A0A977SNX7_CROSA|nr:D27 isomerase [Crocus sativus]
MESSLLLLHHGGGLGVTPAIEKSNRNLTGARRRRSNGRVVVAAATKPSKEMTEYNDNWFDRLAIHHFSRSIQLTTGISNDKKGYDGFVEAASSVARNFDTKDQQRLVIETLNKAVPKAITDMIKTLVPPSKFTRHFFSVFTTIFFPWLVGPCEVRESEFQGQREKNVVYIPKCRFLESTNCVGLCTNLCKMPSQKFIQDSLGMPLYMVPNFEDMSCEMIFGQQPPEPEDDPALKQPCYKNLCIAKQNTGNLHCSSSK